MPETQWMTLLETADLMKMLPTQVTRMCEDGKLEYYREDGRYFVSRESIDLFMHPLIGGPAPASHDVIGTSRREYGRAPDEFDATSRPVTESETVNGRDTAEADVEDKTGDSTEDAVAVDVESEETADASVAREAIEDQETAELQQGMEPQQTGEDKETAETREALETQQDMETQQAVEDQETAVAQQDAERLEMDTAETQQDEESTRQVTEILADLREALERHAAAHKAFCDEVSGLADALERTLSSGEDKTGELTREISSLLARYAKR